MEEKLIWLVNNLMANLREVIVGMIVISCVTATLTGIVKSAFLAKIKDKNKNLFKVLCFLTSMVLLPAVVAVWWVCNGFSFEYFKWFYFAAIPVEIVMYVIYENTLIRNVVNWVTFRFLKAVVPVFFSSVVNKDSEEETKDKLHNATEAVKDDVADQLATTVADNAEFQEVDKI